MQLFIMPRLLIASNFSAIVFFSLHPRICGAGKSRIGGYASDQVAEDIHPEAWL